MASTLKVEVDPDTCIGSGDCVRIAPGAFALEGPTSVVIDPTAEDEETLRQAERSCPTGAITVTSEAVREPEEETIAAMKITARENGPYVIETGGQPVTVIRGGVEEVVERPMIALCRCGQSSNKPFCDGTHKVAEFGEPGAEVIIGS
jgi:CDGSH-type Zn-finger protein/ferredoxin